MTTKTFPQKDSGLWLAIGLVAAAAAARLIPHAPNFTPLGAMALFAGATIADRRLALIAPLAAMFVSDQFLERHPTVFYVYGALVVITLVGELLKKHRRSALRIGGASLVASLLFFLITNFGVWAMHDWYPHTLSGLITCYVAALPFNTVLSDLFFSAVLFGGYALAERYLIERRSMAAAVNGGSSTIGE